MLDVARVVACHLEADGLHAHAAQLLNAPQQAVLAPHGQTPEGVEGGTGPLFPGLLYGGVFGVGQHQEAALLLPEGLLQRLDAVGRLRALGRLPELEFDGLCPAFADGVVGHALQIVVIVGLQHDLPKATVVALKGAQHLLELGGVHNLALLVSQRGVFAHGALPNHGDNAGHGRASKIVLPVELDDCRQDDGQRQLDRVRAADDGVKPHMVDAGKIRVFRRSHRAEDASVDVEVGVVHGIALFRGNLVVSRCVGVDHFHAAHGGKPDFTGADAVRRAHGAHAGKSARVRSVAQEGAVEAGAEQRTVGHIDTPFW